MRGLLGVLGVLFVGLLAGAYRARAPASARDRVRRSSSSRFITSASDSTEGSGLGLAIVRDLAVAHGGSATAVSDGPGRGASFVVQLPMRA